MCFILCKACRNFARDIDSSEFALTEKCYCLYNSKIGFGCVEGMNRGEMGVKDY